MTEFSHALRSWRRSRRFSQLDLALEADVSSRHVSFLETGRAKPSRDMTLRLGEALGLPLSAQNTLLTNAGYAAEFPQHQWDDAQMAPIRGAIDHILSSHTPYPAMALDRVWNVVQMNKPAALLYGILGVSQGDSLLQLLMSDTLPPLIENWGEVAHHTVQRLRTESAAQGGNAVLDAAAAHLGKVPFKGGTITAPVVPTILNTGTLRLSMFGTIAQFGTPEDVTLDEMKIELFFPSDEATKAVLEQMAAG